MARPKSEVELCLWKTIENQKPTGHVTPTMTAAGCELEAALSNALPVRSSMLVGLISTMLKLWSETSRFHRFIRRSSAEMYVSPSLQEETEHV